VIDLKEGKKKKKRREEKIYFLLSVVLLLTTICDHKDEEEAEGDAVGDGVVEAESDGDEEGNGVVVGEGETAATDNPEAGESTFFSSTLSPVGVCRSSTSDCTEISLGEGILYILSDNQTQM